MQVISLKLYAMLSSLPLIFIKLDDILFLFTSIFDEFDKISFSRFPKLFFKDIKFIFS